mgnify:CR=1 FL=1
METRSANKSVVIKSTIGAIIMFVVLGLIPGYVIAKVLHGMGKLRIPREVEIAGLDYEIMETAKKDERAVSSATR